MPAGHAEPQRERVVLTMSATPLSDLAHEAPAYVAVVSVPYPVPYPVPCPVWDFTAASPAYAYPFVGSESTAHPQLVFTDGTTYTVADYWRVEDQLHFATLEDGGTKSVPHNVPFSRPRCATDNRQRCRAVLACEKL